MSRKDYLSGLAESSFVAIYGLLELIQRNVYHGMGGEEPLEDFDKAHKAVQEYHEETKKFINKVPD